MCECGCTSNDDRYLFPAPDKKFYLLTLSAGCIDCDAASGISIELLEKDNYYLQDKDYINGKLKFQNWRDTKGIGIVTGYRRHEFVHETKNHLIGINSAQYCNTIKSDDNEIDEIGAEVILEEMYPDTQFKPKLVK